MLVPKCSTAFGVHCCPQRRSCVWKGCLGSSTAFLRCWIYGHSGSFFSILAPTPQHCKAFKSIFMNAGLRTLKRFFHSFLLFHLLCFYFVWGFPSISELSKMFQRFDVDYGILGEEIALVFDFLDHYSKNPGTGKHYLLLSSAVHALTVAFDIPLKVTLGCDVYG